MHIVYGVTRRDKDNIVRKLVKDIQLEHEKEIEIQSSKSAKFDEAIKKLELCLMKIYIIH